MMLHSGMFVKMTVLTNLNKYSQCCFKVHCTEISFPGNIHSANATTYLVHKKGKQNINIKLILFSFIKFLCNESNSETVRLLHLK